MLFTYIGNSKEGNDALKISSFRLALFLIVLSPGILLMHEVKLYVTAQPVLVVTSISLELSLTIICFANHAHMTSRR